MIQCKCGNLFEVEGEPEACPKCGTVMDRTGHRPGEVIVPASTTSTAPVNIDRTAAVETTTTAPTEPVKSEPSPESESQPAGPEKPEPPKEKVPCDWCGRSFVDVEGHRKRCRKRPKKPAPVAASPPPKIKPAEPKPRGKAPKKSKK